MINKIQDQQQNLFNPLYNSPLPAVLLESDGSLVNQNRVFSEHFSFSQNRVASYKNKMLYSEFALPHDLFELEANQTNMDIELEAHYQGKSRQWFRLFGSSFCGEDGRRLVLIQFLDITEHKEAQESLKKYESFYNNSNEGIVMFDLDGRVVQANLAFEHIFGYKSEELVGKRLPVTPEISLHEGEYLLRETLKGNYIKGFETIKQKKDGTLITARITMSPIRDDQGAVQALAGIVRDITQEKMLYSIHQSFIDHNMDPILIFDHHEKLVRTNPALEQLFGWTADELLGTLAKDMPIIPNEKRDEVNENRVELKRGVEPKRYETVRLKRDGTPIDILLTSFPIMSQLQRGWAIIFKDISDRKEKERLMIQSEKLAIAGELAAGIAHEIRNPMTSIKGFLQLIQQGLLKESYFEIIMSEFDRIEFILSELLVLAKPQVKRFESAVLQEILKQVLVLLTPQANLNGVEIRENFEEEPLLLECDENQLKQVFINMIKNATEAMPDGGHLSIDIVRVNEYAARVRLADDGVGIPKHILSRLGEPFYITKEKGTGLGFMVSKNIIEQHNGTIQVDSVEGQGTTIQVTLPLI